MVLNVVAIVTPAPGKEHRVQEILVDLAANVKKHESDVSRYVPHKVVGRDGTPEFVVVERYEKFFNPSKLPHGPASLGSMKSFGYHDGFQSGLRSY